MLHVGGSTTNQMHMQPLPRHATVQNSLLENGHGGSLYQRLGGPLGQVLEGSGTKGLGSSSDADLFICVFFTMFIYMRSLHLQDFSMHLFVYILPRFLSGIALLVGLQFHVLSSLIHKLFRNSCRVTDYTEVASL